MEEKHKVEIEVAINRIKEYKELYEKRMGEVEEREEVLNQTIKKQEEDMKKMMEGCEKKMREQMKDNKEKIDGMWKEHEEKKREDEEAHKKKTEESRREMMAGVEECRMEVEKKVREWKEKGEKVKEMIGVVKDSYVVRVDYIKFTIPKVQLEVNPLLYHMITSSEDMPPTDDGVYTVDRDVDAFKYIRGYMRSLSLDDLPYDDDRMIEKVRREAEYWGMKEIVDQIDDYYYYIKVEIHDHVYTLDRRKMIKNDDVYFKGMIEGTSSLAKDKRGYYIIDTSDNILEFIKQYTIAVLPKDTIDVDMMTNIYQSCVTHNIAPVVTYMKRGYISSSYSKILYIRDSCGGYNTTYSDIHDSIIEVDGQIDRDRYDSIVFNDYTCIMICCICQISNIDRKVLGDKLADYVDNGGNVVLCMNSNISSVNHPAGRFESYHPFKLQACRSLPSRNDKVDICMKDHPIMNNINTLQYTNTTYTIVGDIQGGDIEVVGKWKSGGNMIGIRYDKKGMIVSIGCEFGKYMKGDMNELLRNAVRYRKYIK